MQKNRWLSKLASLGVWPQDVTDVVNTHLHLDHVGWNTLLVRPSWEPTFPRARYIMPRLEAELAHSGGLMKCEANDRTIEDSVLPVIDAGLADFASRYMTVAPDIRLIPCHGHSPGILLVESSGAPGAIVGGDPLHHVAGARSRGEHRILRKAATGGKITRQPSRALRRRRIDNRAGAFFRPAVLAGPTNGRRF